MGINELCSPALLGTERTENLLVADASHTSWFGSHGWCGGLRTGNLSPHTKILAEIHSQGAFPLLTLLLPLENEQDLHSKPPLLLLSCSGSASSSPHPAFAMFELSQFSQCCSGSPSWEWRCLRAHTGQGTLRKSRCC